MTILDRFVYLFEADAKALKQGIKEADDETKKLDDTIDKTDKGAIDLGVRLKETVLEFATALGALLAVDVLKDRTLEAARYADELGLVAQKLHVGVGDLQVWEQAQKAVTGSGESMRESFAKLQEGARDFARTGGGDVAVILSLLGIRMRDATGAIKGPMELLPQLASQFQKLSYARQIQFGQKLGLSQETILLLQKGRAAVDELIKKQKEYGVITADDTRVAREYAVQQDATSNAWRRVALDAAQYLLPALDWVASKFEHLAEWIHSHHELFTGFIVGLAAIITAVYLPAIASAVAATFLWLLPFVAIGAAVAAVGAIFALVWEDIAVYLEGGNSLIGKLINRFPKLAEAVKEVGAVFVWLWDLLNIGVNAIAEFLTTGKSLSQIFSEMGAASQKAFDDLLNRAPNIKAFFDSIGNFAHEAADYIKKEFAGVLDVITGIIDGATKAFDTVKNGANNAGDWVGRQFGFGDKDHAGEPSLKSRPNLNDRHEAQKQLESAPLPFYESWFRKSSADNANAAGQADIASASAQGVMGPAITPAAAIPTAAIVASNSHSVSTDNSRSIQVTTGDITVETQATDANGVANGLAQHFGTLVTQFDDGIHS